MDIWMRRMSGGSCGARQAAETIQEGLAEAAVLGTERLKKERVKERRKSKRNEKK